ncbi:hypothetical protein L596_030138 [Steinernema carpocapsae]|uniref:MIF4G domain-containing protein n=1 Tax=Steinernema carpocapsae TaxID=34508 RepID=A0A4U5LRU4_STECR|nr:hypothetical protein L596_030138 [Steinernema carpocapsae]
MGNIGLIAQLYRNKLVSLKILNLCIATLLKTHEESRKSDEESLECAIKLISDVGKSWEQRRSSEIRQKRLRYHVKPQVEIDLNLHDIACLQNLAPTLSNRLSFKVLDLLDLRKNKWEPRKSQPRMARRRLRRFTRRPRKRRWTMKKSGRNTRSRKETRGEDPRTVVTLTFAK